MNYKNWSTRELAGKLSSLNLSQYSKYFISHEICGKHLPYLTEEHLEEMGISVIGDRLLLMKVISDFVNGVTPAPAEQQVEATPTQPPRSARSSRLQETFPDTSSDYNPKYTKMEETPAKQSRTDQFSSDSSTSSRKQQQKEQTVVCQSCGRSFPIETANKHIPICKRIHDRNRGH